MNSLDLKSYFKRVKSNDVYYPETTAIRIHRGMSWLIKAEENQNDLDSSFLYLWICFNAAYAQELSRDSFSESELFNDFIRKTISLDKEDKIQMMLFGEFSQAIRILLDNKYVYQPFWNFQNKTTVVNWQGGFIDNNKKAFRAIVNKDTHTTIRIIFSRLYTLRNQIIHGGSTFNSQVNRHQLRDGCKIMFKLMQHIFLIMIENPSEFSGSVIYPLVKE